MTNAKGRSKLNKRADRRETSLSSAALPVLGLRLRTTLDRQVRDEGEDCDGLHGNGDGHGSSERRFDIVEEATGGEAGDGERDQRAGGNRDAAERGESTKPRREHQADEAGCEAVQQEERADRGDVLDEVGVLLEVDRADDQGGEATHHP